MQLGDPVIGYQNCFMASADQFRDLQAPLEFAGLMHDVREMINVPLEICRARQGASDFQTRFQIP